MRDTAAEQSHLFPWHLSPVACSGSPSRIQPTPSSSVGQGPIDRFCLACQGKVLCPSCVFPLFLEERPSRGTATGTTSRSQGSARWQGGVCACWARAQPSSCPPLKTELITSQNRAEIKQPSAIKIFCLLFHLSSQGLRASWQYERARLPKALQSAVRSRGRMEAGRLISLPRGVQSRRSHRRC